MSVLRTLLPYYFLIRLTALKLLTRKLQGLLYPGCKLLFVECFVLASFQIPSAFYL